MQDQDERFVAAYSAARTEKPNLNHLPFAIAFAFFRMAAILQGVVRRGPWMAMLLIPRPPRKWRPIFPCLLQGLKAAKANSETIESIVEGNVRAVNKELGS